MFFTEEVHAIRRIQYGSLFTRWRNEVKKFLVPAPFCDRTFYYPSSLIKTDSYIPTLYSKLHKLPASIYGNCLFARYSLNARDCFSDAIKAVKLSPSYTPFSYFHV